MTQFEDLLAVQEADTHLDQLRHRRETLPERAAVAATAGRYAELEQQLAGVQAERDAIAAVQAGLEREVAELESKREHVSGQLYGGTVTAHKDLEALQHELGTLESMQRDLEDRILEQMELAEPLDARLEAMRPDVEASRSAMEAAQAALAEAEAVVDGEIAEAEARRAELVAAVPDDLLRLYDAIRGRLGGVGAARLDGARCTGCHLEIPAGELTEVRRSPADAVVHCPECGRILVR